MIELAIAGRAHLTVSRVDVDRPGPCYTVDTLRLLRAEFGPDAAFFFIEGADSLVEMVAWYQANPADEKISPALAATIEKLIAMYR